MITSQDQSNGKPTFFNTNTYVSLFVVLLLLGGFGWINKGLNDNAKATSDLSARLDLQLVQTNNRLTALEQSKNAWGYGDMLRWSIHLQQLNKDAKKLQSEGLAVPEPEAPTK